MTQATVAHAKHLPPAPSWLARHKPVVFHTVHDTRTLPEIDAALSSAHDAISTTDAFTITFVACLSALVACYMFRLRTLDDPERGPSVFAEVVSAPLVAIGSVGVLTSVLTLIAWRYDVHIGHIMTVGGVLTLLGMIVAVGVIEPIEREWTSAGFTADPILITSGTKLDLQKVASVMLIVLPVLGAAIGVTSERVRADRFAVYDPVFLSLFISSAICAHIMCQVSVLILETALTVAPDQTDADEVGFTYFGMAILIFGVMMGLLSVGGRLAAWIVDNSAKMRPSLVPPPHLSPGAITAVQLARHRTHSMTRWIILFAFALPVLIVWTFRSGFRPWTAAIEQGGGMTDADAVEDGERATLEERWGAVSVMAPIIVAALPLIGLLGAELVILSKPVASLLGAVMAAFVVFGGGLMTIHWNASTSFILFGVVVLAVAAFITGSIGKSTSGICLVMASFLVAIKAIAAELVKAYEDQEGTEVPDGVRLALWAAPITIVALFWVVRIYDVGGSFRGPVLFLFFCVFYVAIFAWPRRDEDLLLEVPNAGPEANIAIDFIVVFALLLVAVHASMVMYDGAKYAAGLMYGNNKPLTTNLFSFVAFVTISFTSAFLYDAVQTDDNVIELIGKMQAGVAVEFDRISRDIKRGLGDAGLAG